MSQPNASSVFIELDSAGLSRRVGLGGPFVRRERVEVLSGLDLKLPGRGLVVVTGGPGSGKTSLLLLLCGAVKPDAGRLVVDGVEPWRLSRRKRKQIFGKNLYLGQNPALWHLAGRVNELERRAVRVAVTLAGNMAGTIATLDRWRRLALALGVRAARSPAALLLDDPLTGLGPAERGKLVPWMDGQAAERLVVVADPGRGLLEEIAGKVVEL